MIDYYIRVADAAAMHTTLIAAGAAQDADGHLVPADGVAIDIIGTWYDPPAAEGEAPQPRRGYYANVRSEAPIDWPEGVIEAEPVTPWRIWA